MRQKLWLVLLMGTSLVGCQRSSPLELRYVSSKQVESLPPELQSAVRDELQKYCGTPAIPKLIGNPRASLEHLQHGAAVYRQRCAACHGVSGDGNGAVAATMYPRPRDYRKGIFKFTSTPYGSKPLRDDLVLTLRRGAKGTSMPSFKFLPDEDIEAVVDYVLVLTHRGELETLLYLEADSEEELDPDNVADYADQIAAQWERAKERVVHPVTVEPPYTAESIKLGREAFLSELGGCFKCHGKDGRGNVMEGVEAFKDVWGHKTLAADLTSGMFHGGNRSLDIYRRIYSGINGTPMPAFNLKLAEKPETFWHLVHYVQYVSGARRRATMAQQAEFYPALNASAEGDKPAADSGD